MKTVLLCGGLGTRLREETEFKPKTMVEIGLYPILWHIMNIYSAAGFNEFILALGYKGELIKDYFINYYHHSSDLTIDLKGGRVMESQNNCARDWLVHLIDTGQNSMTGGRLARLKKQLGGETFMVTYGDGVSNIDIRKLVAFHKSHGKKATVSAVRPAARFGGLQISGGRVTEFKEKPQIGEGWINGGFFVFEPSIFDYLDGDDTILETEPLEALAREGELMAFNHNGFWQCMDTLRDRENLIRLWQSGKAPWKVW